MKRIAVGSIFTESNHLVGRLTEMADFERTELRRGGELLTATDGVVGGMLRELSGCEVRPLMYASAVPGGPLSSRCYAALKAELLARLRAALPVDGVLMPQHGAAAVEELGSLDGDLIGAVREVVGGAVPVVATLDCHAHVTAEMVRDADALAAWETYPHRDTFTTGERGARLLKATVEGRARPRMAMAKAPVIVGGFMGSTDDGPFAGFMRRTKALEGRAGVLSTSAFLVQPQLDLPGMGGGALVVTDGDMAMAEREATALAREYWSLRFSLEPRIWEPAAAIADGLRRPAGGAPVLLLETSDCVGGGAPGDSAAVLKALAAADPAGGALACVVDPEAAAACHDAGRGRRLRLRMGHALDPQWGLPFEADVDVEALTDGTFVYSGGIWGGQRGNMGLSASVRIGNVRVLLASQGTYDWADEQYRSVGMDTDAARFIVVKNPMNYRVGYAGRHSAAYVLDTPGPTPASLRHVRFQRLARPFFPQDEDIAGFVPAVLRGRE
ncbi:MAG: M81 family metallopeptidase [Acidobacteria bacterium]|nr:M81 family metallopeptidase [Acidobacteriota bacterium]